MTIADAASALGVSPGTLRRRARRGELAARKDEGGRYLVEVDAAGAELLRHASKGAAAELQSAELERLRQELDQVQREVAHRDALLDESRRRADRAERESDRLAQQLAAATVRELQIIAQSDLYALADAEFLAEEAARAGPAERPDVAEAQEEATAAASAPRGKRWWQPWRRAAPLAER